MNRICLYACFLLPLSSLAVSPPIGGISAVPPDPSVQIQLLLGTATRSGLQAGSTQTDSTRIERNFDGAATHSAHLLPKTGGWWIAHQERANYNPQNRADSTWQQIGDTLGNLTTLSAVSHRYEPNGLLDTLMMRWLPTGNMGAWQVVSRARTQYDFAARPSEQQTDSLVGNQMMPVRQRMWEYNNQLISAITQHNWQNGVWVPQYRIDQISGNASSTFSAYRMQAWNNGLQTYQDSLQYRRETDAYGRLMEEWLLRVTNGNTDTLWRKQQTFDAQNRPAEQWLRKKQNGLMGASMRTSYQYNNSDSLPNGALVRLFAANFSDSLSFQANYTYDEQNWIVRETRIPQSGITDTVSIRYYYQSFVYNSVPETKFTEQLFYPNPAKDQLFWAGADALSAFTIFDLQGRRVFHREGNLGVGGNMSPTLEPGLYLIRWATRGGNVGVQRVVFEP